MIANTAETLAKGMNILADHMGLVEAEMFIFLIKTESFDYTEWQREYFDGKTKQELDDEMDAYFSSHPYKSKAAKVL